jgi:hypothetical protein
MKVGDLFVGKSLIVGDPTLALTGIGRPPVNIRGTAYVEAPMIVGDDSKFPFPEATMMIGRCTNVDAAALIPGLFRIRNLIPGTETPQDVVIGDPSGPVGVTFFCGTSMFSVQAATINLLGLLKVSTFPVVTNVEGILSDIGSKVFAGAKTEAGVDANLSKALNAAPVVGSTIEKFMDFVTGATTLNKTFGIAVSKKSFDISHPTKENHRLRYVCLEGPSAEVYVRGKLRGSNKIELPEYWKGLVDPDSITVTLTPIGTFQELFYEEVEWCSTIKVMNAAGGPVNCSYTVFAERKDTPKNIPEYQGLTPLDYPGDNDNYLVNDGK